MKSATVKLNAVLALTLAAAVVLAWLWHCWCIFPWYLWNELRLEPSFLLVHGGTVYPAVGEGPVTTWIYGPLTPLLFLPATLAHSTASALLAAGLINILLVVAPIVVVCKCWPAAQGVTLSLESRLTAGLLCFALWPASSFQYIQADNAAVALGLLANLALIRSRSDSDWTRWLAAVTAVAALGCKQTALGVLGGQLIWIAWREGGRNAIRHALRASVCTVALGLGSLAIFDPAGLWLNVVQIPARLPWSDVAGTRIRELLPLLLMHIAFPCVVMLGARRHVWHRESPLALPSLCWVVALIPGLLSLLKIGGNVNSLEGLLLFLPPALLFGVAHFSSVRGLRIIFPLAAALAVLARFQLVTTPGWTPRIAQLRQAELISKTYPEQIWFPWNPLVTFYSARRFDHVEDGLYVRFVTGLPLTFAEARAGLPPKWRGMAMVRGSFDWGLAAHLCPSDAQVDQLGFWTLTTWNPAK
ncbi:MAG: hypothetical protein ABIZ04_14415 [Opitutus sp.]